MNIDPYGSVMVSNLESIIELGKYELSYCFGLCYAIIRPFLKPIFSILLCDYEPTDGLS